MGNSVKITDINSQPIGKVCLTPQGTYDGGKAYAKLDVVNFYGTSYIALKDVPIGCSPVFNDNNEYWNLIASGAVGTPYVDENGVYTYTQASNFTLEGVKTVAGISPIGLDIPADALSSIIEDRIYETVKRKIFDDCYPTGTIYTTTDACKPTEIFGPWVGAWELIENKFIYGGNADHQPSACFSSGNSVINLATSPVCAQIGFIDNQWASTPEYNCNPQTIFLTRLTTASNATYGNFTAHNGFTAGNKNDQLNLDYARLSANDSMVNNVNGVALSGNLNIMPPYYVAYNWLRIEEPVKYVSGSEYSIGANVYADQSIFTSNAQTSKELSTEDWDDISNIISFVIPD